jgi:hypothetical protein
VHNAIDASFADESTKTSLRARVASP